MYADEAWIRTLKSLYESAGIQGKEGVEVKVLYRLSRSLGVEETATFGSWWSKVNRHVAVWR